MRAVCIFAACEGSDLSPADEPTAEPANAAANKAGALSPLRNSTFRTIWIASLLSNFGTMIQAVGAAWEMTRLTNAPEMVALVQTATTLPLMLFTVPAGAIADVMDRRKVAMAGLLVSMMSAVALTALALSGMTSPWSLFACCVSIGIGTALYTPAWQSSVSELVGRNDLTAAVAMTSLSQSVARSFGPALGGALVVSAGATIAFGVNAVSYLPLLIAYFLWKRVIPPSAHASERIDRAIVSGWRFVLHSESARMGAIRAFAVTFASAALTALMPLIAKHLLQGNAATYGLLLGAYGIGSVATALAISRLRERFSPDALNRAGAAVSGLATLLAAASNSLALTLVAMFIAGGAWVVMLAVLNVSVQMGAPRWVTGRALAWYQAALTGGVAIGAWMWGQIASFSTIPIALALSGAAMLLIPLLGKLLPLPQTNPLDATSVDVAREPRVGLPITARSGPVVLEVDYDVAPQDLDEFSGLMLRVQTARLRNGAFDWTLARDIANPRLWTERYYFATWGDYLRQRSRFTEADHQLYRDIRKMRAGEDAEIRRRLERPIGASGGFDRPPADFMPPQTS
jgi:MFS family permease